MKPEFTERRPSISQLSKLQSERLLLSGRGELKQLSVQYNVPEEDILLIALNASGIKYKDVINDRGRFIATFPNGNRYLLALTINYKPLSPFEYKNGQVMFDERPVAQASPIEKDTCTTSYWRGGKKHLTLNSNSRSNCKGCSICGTYSLEGDDRPLTQPDELRRVAEILYDEIGQDFSSLESVGIVTGCFPSESKVVDHIMMTHEVFDELGFAGEIRYIGSQLRSDKALQKTIAAGPFALYLTIEAFERREKLIKRAKSSLDLERGRQVLAKAKELGAETCFLYIAGLDSHAAMQQEFPLYTPLLTRLPHIQTFQVYQPDQAELRHPEATSVEYFLETRQIVENTYPDLLPIAANNYRSLWYTKYNRFALPNEEI